MTYRPQPSSAHVPKPSDKDLQIIIQGGDVASAELTVRWAEQLGKTLAQAKLTTSQIRGIFGQVRQIEMAWSPDDTDSPYAEAAKRSLILLTPKIEYQAGREAERKKYAVRELAEILIPAIKMVGGDRANFQRFTDFFEAILAYHKAAGGE